MWPKVTVDKIPQTWEPGEMGWGPSASVFTFDLLKITGFTVLLTAGSPPAYCKRTREETLEPPCRRFGCWHERWFHAYKGTMLQMPYFTKQLAAETKQFRLHYEHLSDGNMKRKKWLRPESSYRLWSSDGFIIQQTVSLNTQALRWSGAFPPNHYSMAETHVFYNSITLTWFAQKCGKCVSHNYSMCMCFGDQQ